MLLLGVIVFAALISSVSISAIPYNPRALNTAVATPYAHQSRSQPPEPRWRTLDPSRPLIDLNETLSLSESAVNLTAHIDHEIDCFPRGSRLYDANANDCNFIINSIILGIKDPFREQSWGFTDWVDINLSLPEYKWAFGGCFMRVKNLDESQVDRFRPVDVAELAQRIVQTCVVETKEPLGGNGDIGHLGIPLSFYVVVAGTKTASPSLNNTTVLSLPSNELHNLESRASLVTPQENTISSSLTEGWRAGERYPVHCFDPFLTPHVKPAIPSDCAIIINEVIIRLPNPMLEQTFGYTDAEDINLSRPEDRQWIYGQCAIFIENFNRSSRDVFRFLDVAQTAHRILEKCVEESKYAIGGTADIGTIEDNFYVGLGGIDNVDVGNGRILELASDTVATSPSAASRPSYPSNSTKIANLDRRSTDIAELSQGTNAFAPTVRCLQPGMPAARDINMQDCTNAAMVILHDPKVLMPQQFTTETSGGIRMPFVQHNQSCYLMIDSKSDLSITDLIPPLKMVYWALEIMLKCIAGREHGVGGVSRLDESKEIFVSVTGVDPIYVADGLASLSDGSDSNVNLENTSLQIADLGQS